MAKEFKLKRKVVLQNHAIDGGQADPSNWITVPQGTTAQLAALIRRVGAVAWDTDQDMLVADDGSGFQPVGSGGDAADATLSNLTAPTAINADLIFDLGDSAVVKTADASGVPSEDMIIKSGDSDNVSGDVIIESGISDGTRGDVLIEGNTVEINCSTGISLDGGSIDTNSRAILNSAGIFPASQHSANIGDGALAFGDIYAYRNQANTLALRPAPMASTSTNFRIQSDSSTLPGGHVVPIGVQALTPNEDIGIATADSAGTATGDIIIATGDVTSGATDSGSIILYTGIVDSGARSSVVVDAASFIVPLATADPAGQNGAIYFNTSTSKLRLYDGSIWVDLN
jgi:hypothetical protein